MSKQPNFIIYNVPLATSKYPIKATHAMKPEGITIHETDNNASARNEIAYMQRNNNLVSFHFAVDEKEVIQGLPLDRNSWNAGDGANGFGNRKTISVEIARNHRTEDLTNYYAARERAERLVGWLLYVNGWGAKEIYTHQNHSGKNCPRVMLREGYVDKFKVNAVKYRDEYINAKVSSKAPAAKPSTGKLNVGEKVKINQSAGTYANSKTYIPKWAKDKEYTILQVNSTGTLALIKELYSWVKVTDLVGFTAPVAAKPKAKTVDELVAEVMRGEHGAGQARKDSLGSRYSEVQNKINVNTQPKPSAPTESHSAKIDRLVHEVMMGKHGSGEARRKSLGSDYSEVQNRINAGSTGKAAAPSKPVESHSAKINRLVSEVMAGKHGTGDARKKSLGSDYTEVQNKINEGATSKPSNSPIKVGDMVVVREGARSYEGVKVTSAWYRTPKVVSQISGDRVVLDAKSWATAFKMTDLIKR